MATTFRWAGARSASRLTVWVDPGTAGAPRDLVRAVERVARLVVVPRTGTRQADVAVLLDPLPETLGRVRQVLPGAVVLALPARVPSIALRAAAVIADVHLLAVGTSPGQLLLEFQAIGRTAVPGASPASEQPHESPQGVNKLLI